MNKKWIMIVMMVLLLSGCGTEETDSDTNAREVSSKAVPMECWDITRWCEEEGDFRDSGIVYEDKVIEFKDAVVEEMLRNMINKPDGDVYISDLQEIHSIFMFDDGYDAEYFSNLQQPANGDRIPLSDGPWEIKQMESLEDLAYCYNLQALSLSGIEIPSLEPLFDLPQLEKLSFIDGQLKHKAFPNDIMEQAGEIKTLQCVTFGRYELTTIEPLCQLPELKSLEFNGTVVNQKVLEDIGKLPALTYFRLGTCDPGVTGTSGYSTYWGDLTDGSFLLPLAEQLTVLCAAGGIDWNPSVLAKMTNLESMRIQYAEDISFFENMPKLRELGMYCCTPEDWSPLASLGNMENLSISGNMYTKIEIGLDDLRSLQNLKYLDFSMTTISDDCTSEEIIDTFPKLEALSLFLWE